MLNKAAERVSLQVFGDPATHQRRTRNLCPRGYSSSSCVHELLICPNVDNTDEVFVTCSIVWEKKLKTITVTADRAFSVGLAF